MAEMESLNQNLIAKERKSNDELQEVCKKLMDKEEDLEQMEATIQSLIVKERASDDKLQGVREELINCLEKFGSSDFIGIKRMGDLELKPFNRAAKIVTRKQERELQSCAQFGRIASGIQAGILLRLSWEKKEIM
ncbi:hypothetical protein ACB092_08G057800 [Castanea dentata]